MASLYGTCKVCASHPLRSKLHFPHWGWDYMGIQEKLLLCTVISQPVLSLSNLFVWYTLAIAEGCMQRKGA